MKTLKSKLKNGKELFSILWIAILLAIVVAAVTVLGKLRLI